MHTIQLISECSDSSNASHREPQPEGQAPTGNWGLNFDAQQVLMQKANGDTWPLLVMIGVSSHSANAPRLYVVLANRSANVKASVQPLTLTSSAYFCRAGSILASLLQTAKTSSQYRLHAASGTPELRSLSTHCATFDF